MKLKATNVFERIDKLPPATRLVVLEGGARSSKTWSILQILILYCFKNRNQRKRITICRAKLTWLKATVLPDFIEIMYMFGWWNINNFNRTELTYTLYGNEISFIGLDEEQKLRGRKQNIFWINEANECRLSDYKQLMMRTSERGYMDYNPSMTEHWIFEKVIPRPDCAFLHSTMLDNPFLDKNVRNEILSMEPTPENIAAGTADRVGWEIYGLGKRAIPEGLVFPNWETVPAFPDERQWKKHGYFMDYGFTNDPTAIGEVVLANGIVYAKELCYERGLTNIYNPETPHQKSIDVILRSHGITARDTIVAESAEPKSNIELTNAGFTIIPAIKGPDSINTGIDILRRYPVFLIEPSVNAVKEKNNYKWKEDKKTGKFTNEPVNVWNHFIDGLRYWAILNLHNPAKREDKQKSKSDYGFF